MKKILGLMFFVAMGILFQLVNAEDTLKTAGTDLSTPAVNTTQAKGDKAKKSKFIYVCPMNGYTSDKPGACPKCGMDLEKQIKAEGKAASTMSRMNGIKNQSSSFDLAKYGKGEKAKICPVSGDKINPGEGVETRLSNGKKIMLCCPQCKKPVGKDLKTYESLMYD